MYADYHLHSEFSDDSGESMENQIARAIELGLDEMCFTDHVDYGIKKDWDDPRGIQWRGGDGMSSSADEMSPLANVNYPEYFAKLLRMRATFGSKISIRSGLEFGIQSITVQDYEKLFTKYRNELDFVLFSMHQVNNQEFWNQQFQEGKTQQEYNEQYYIIMNSEKTFLRKGIGKCFELIPTLQKDKSTRIKELEKLKV